jgi:hypothetical protein
VYFASWAIDALARVVGSDPGLRGWLAPRRVSFVRVVDGSVRVPGRPPQPLPELAARVLAACDGVRLARDIRQELAGAADGADIYDLLDDLVARRWLVWRLEVPADARPERYLRQWLTRVGDPQVRERGLAKLAVLERGRQRIRAAGQDPERLCAALAELEADFVELTEEAAVREKGAKTAPCRAVVYADSRRSAQVTLGDEVLTALAPLELLLTSATWLTRNLADSVAAGAQRVFDQLADGDDGAGVSLASLWFACMPLLHGEMPEEMTRLEREFQQRWAALLRPEAGARRVHRTVAELTEGVRETFDAPGRSWAAARYLSPDIMIMAADRAAIERGEFELVLGELHVASNTLGASLFVNQHPAPDELFDRTDLDHPEPRLLPMLPKEHRSRLSGRIRHALVRPIDYQVALVDHTVDPARPRTVLSADATVVRRGGELVVVLPDGAEFHLLEVFSHVLTTLVMDRFAMLPEADHTPRVTVDRMVVSRERWRFGPEALEFAEERNEARRFVRARRWRAVNGLPRFVFVTSPSEPRPFYVDFDAPVYVNIFAKAVRRLRRSGAGRLTVTEMLPTPEQTWLTDDAGNRYTAELRLTAVDQLAPAGVAAC